MLKACCDCVAARIREENDVYGTQLNGNNLRAPLYPGEIKDSTMFVLPKKLNFGDRINITGNMTSNPQSFSLSLIAGNVEPDYNNIVAQLEIQFPLNNPDEKITLATTVNGRKEITVLEHKPSAVVSSLQSPPLEITFENFGNRLEFYIEGSYLGPLMLQHNVDIIRYMILEGDVEKVKKLEFEFA